MVPAVWWTKTALTVSLYSGASGLIDSSAPQPARDVIGGRGTVDGGAAGSVADGDVLALAVGEPLSVTVGLCESDVDGEGSDVVGSVAGDEVSDASGVGESTGTDGSADGSVDGSAGFSSAATKAAGSAFSAVPLPESLPGVFPGATVSSRRPAGSLAETLSPAVTRTSTPFDGPTQRGSVAPRTPERPVSVRPSRSVSRGSQDVQFPSAADRVRTSTDPDTLAAGSVHVTPSMLNGAVSRRPSDAELPSADTFSAASRTSARTGPALLSALSSELPVMPWNTRTPATAVVATAAVAQSLRRDLKSYPL